MLQVLGYSPSEPAWVLALFFFFRSAAKPFCCSSEPVQPENLSGIPSTFSLPPGNKVSHFCFLLPPSFSHHTLYEYATPLPPPSPPCALWQQTSSSTIVDCLFWLGAWESTLRHPFPFSLDKPDDSDHRDSAIRRPFFCRCEICLVLGHFLLSRNSLSGQSRLIPIACLRQLSPHLGRFDIHRPA